jgi:hypothetical protein
MKAPALVDVRSGPRWALSVLCLVFFAATVTAMALRVRGRQAWGADEGRNPAATITANVIEDDAEASLILAEAMLEAPPRDGEPTGGGPGARELVLDALEGRPGSAHGRLVLARAAGPGSATLWIRPYELARVAAPGLEFGRAEVSQRYLAAWLSLAPEDRVSAQRVLREAFRDPVFVQANLGTALATLGPDLTVRILPDDPAILDLAERILRERGEGRAAELLARRREASRTGS